MVVKPRVLGIVLAGGEGKRLWPLTADRAKPAVPFGGNFRLIDFVLSNLVNAGYLRICVLTQYKSHSLDRHITTTWRMSQMLGNYVTPVPAQQRLGPRWYTGSADAILQSLNLVYDDDPEYLVVFGADHVYRMDPSQMVADHIESGAEATVAGIRVPRQEATAFGVIDTDEAGHRITRFLEKPADPPAVQDDPNVSYASMGNYVFTTKALIEALKQDAADENSIHDMGGNIIPMFVDRGAANVYDFDRNRCRAPTNATAVIGATSVLSTPITTRTWTWCRCIRSSTSTTRSGRFSPCRRRFRRRNSSRTEWRWIPWSDRARSFPAPPSGGRWCRRTCGSQVGASVEGSVIMPGVRIGRNAVVRNAILDKNVIVPDGATVGINLESDRAAYTVTPSGITVIGKGITVAR